MARSPSKGWKTAPLSPLDIALDRDNPRINIDPNDKEPDIVLKLLLHEEVQELARKIAQTGLLPGERIIVVQENRQWVVLEGNRRICACKLLLSPQLVPQQYRKTFPKLTTAGQIDLIKSVEADVAPNRKAAEPILTLRHMESGVRKWKPVARMRRVRRLLDEGFTVGEVAREYNVTPANIRKTIREYKLLKLAEELSGLTKSEQQKLSNPDLKTNPYTRFFELQNVKEYLGISFDENGEVTIEPPRKKFDAKLKLVVKDFLSNPNFDTRTEPVSVFGGDFKKFKAPAAAKPAKSAPQKTKGAAPAAPAPAAPSGQIRPDRFFENLTCRVSDNSIAAVVVEIKKITAEQFPISATYLLRTLVELCLRRLIANAGKAIAGKADPTLSELVNYALNNRDIFPSKRMADVIDAAKAAKAFDYLNIVAHQKWMNADPVLAKSVANQLRNFIQHVVQGEP